MRYISRSLRSFAFDSIRRPRARVNRSFRIFRSLFPEIHFFLLGCGVPLYFVFALISCAGGGRVSRLRHRIHDMDVAVSDKRLY